VVGALLELDVSLTIVDENLAVINDGDLGETFLGVQEYIENCSDANDYESTNY
jgi:hypothetical protein